LENSQVEWASKRIEQGAGGLVVAVVVHLLNKAHTHVQTLVFYLGRASSAERFFFLLFFFFFSSSRASSHSA
jgi:hypothetical protein